MKKISNILLSGLAPITLLTTASLATSCNPQPVDEELIHDTSVYFHTPELAKTITVVDLSGFDADLRDDMNTTFQSLQGLIVQQTQKASLFVKSGVNERDRWFYDMQKKYHFHVRLVNNVKHESGDDIWDVLEENKELFNNQYIKYVKADATSKDDDKRNNISINNATMFTAAKHSLMVSDKLLAKYQNQFDELGFTFDGSFDAGEGAFAVYTRYKDYLNKTMLLNQDPVDFALRDYAIAAKIPVVCVGLLDEFQRDQIAADMKPNSPMFGWSHGFDGEMEDLGGEQPYLIWATQHKLNVLASDHCYNLSFYSYDQANKAYRQPKHNKLVANPKKHYLAIVMSDGDNIQWMQNDFLTSPEYWGSPYRGDFPLSWTISPSPIDLNNSILEKLYAQATPNDELIAGPSGYAYINPAWYWQDKDNLKEAYNAYAKRTAEYMHDCDLTIANPLDFRNPDWPQNNDHPTNPECMTPFMQQDQIKGLVWSLDSLSLDGHGSIDWINDKPLLSFREGIWDNDHLKREKVLERLKTYPRNIHEIDGYTALVVNVWAKEGKMYNIKEFVDSLPEDVELVTISQLLQLISDNVPHVHDVPEQYPDCI